MLWYHGAWILPIADPPIRNGWIAVDRGRIVAAGSRAPAEGERAVDLGSVAVLPGLVNAHTHLELSYLRDEVPPTSEFVQWIRSIIAARRRTDPKSPHVVESIGAAIAEALACGTAIVGDITNSLVSFAPLAASPLAGVVFYELIAFNADSPAALVERAVDEIEQLPLSERVRPSLAAHAPYSVAPLVFRAIREAVDHRPFAPCSVHLSESAEEVEFIRSGGGPWRSLLEEVGAWDAHWVAPGGTPVQFLDECGFLRSRVLAVHGVQMGQADLARLVARRATLVTCPRSNAHTGAGAPPIADFYTSGVRVAVGTDSLASAPDLNVFAELATMRALAPSVPAARLIDSATRQGAHALGFDGEYGTIEPGKRARLIAVDVPAGVEDVEEYLVSGIRCSAIKWLDEG